MNENRKDKPSLAARLLAYARANLFTLALLAVFGGFLVYQRLPLYLESRRYVGRPAPAFTLRDMDGMERSIEEQKGKIVLLNFWATWCMPCRLEIPLLKSMYAELHGNRFEMLAITGESPEIVRSFIAKNPVNYPIVFDPGGQVMREYGVAVFPTLVFIDERGRITDIGQGLDPLLKWKLRYRVKGEIF